PVLSQKFRNQEKNATDYWQKQGKCLYCVLAKEEIEKKERIILSTPYFTAFTPYASQSPFEVWIFPTRHQHSFGNISAEETKDLAKILPQILFKFYSKLDNPDYNYIIHSYFENTADKQAKHWFLQILPRLTPIGGYELGSGIFINIVKPEAAAEFLRLQATGCKPQVAGKEE
ncbi:MAG: galactose-1-phosphate uridylyltransferase, partial [Candidatus Omnitrophica bacterium]|nr:galactose-1-phosphate uridylyltransferase [Candidatus Omnitrophota bacterium]